jgi:hypothetical protein
VYNPTLKATYLVPCWVEALDRLSGKRRRSLVFLFVLRERCILRSAKVFGKLFAFLGAGGSPRGG